MPERKKSTAVYFSSLEIENVRCFGDSQRLNLTAADGRPARWTLILGDNGVGKTTLLQCLAWMRLLPEGDSESSKTTADNGTTDLPFLVKGKLYSALSFEENSILESRRQKRATTQPTFAIWRRPAPRSERRILTRRHPLLN